MLLDKETMNKKKKKKFSSLLSLSQEFDLITVIKGKKMFSFVLVCGFLDSCS